MAISVLLKDFTRRGQPSISFYSSSYGYVFRNVNSPWTSSLLSNTFTSLGSRAYCSKPYHSDPAAQISCFFPLLDCFNQTKKLPESTLTKVVFKYVCPNDKSQDGSRPLIRKVLEIPTGDTFFGIRYGDKGSYYNLNDFCYSYLIIMDIAADALNLDCMIHHISKTEASFPSGNDSGINIYLDKLFEIRIWEKITSSDKHVLEIIVSELKSNGFDFTKDPVALQKIEGAVERAMMRMTNGIKLNLPVPAGEPDISTTISWGKCAGLPILETITLPPNALTAPRLQ
ncbi:hypothetical protein MKW98_016216 [Papaver atlanticum]|uniref:Uncharacterized protein n=1 Tax=Papaver atlanticum TaxID=357466 RepID=A0AAD4SIF6_9MAGN|nr:hypothetical protein MKW98_016216 [Papaver atlanticum]